MTWYTLPTNPERNLLQRLRLLQCQHLHLQPMQPK
jgi:hypothetical protein